jgi:uncharacterized protein YbjT (DUF2867 family)
MDKSDKIILVTGATGHQGGAVARHLLEQGWPVRALTRDAKQPAADALAARGAQIAEGDMDHPESLPKALEGVYGVFSVQNFWEVGYDREVAEGKAIADAAFDAEVRHFVYSSVGGADRSTGLAHFESKWEIEEYVRRLGLRYTILRPVFFMDNLLAMREDIMNGRIAMGLREDTKLQMIAVDDIGALAAMAFEDPNTWMDRATEIAGDELTIPEVCRQLSALLDKSIEYVETPMEEALAKNKEQAEMWKWFNDYGYEGDIAWLREQYPELKGFNEWVELYWPVAAAV